MYAFSNHNAKGFYTDLFEEALASILYIIDVKEAYTHFQYLEQPRRMRAGGGEDENLTSYVKISMGAIFMNVNRNQKLQANDTSALSIVN